MIEQWRTIKGFEGRYEISNLGRVRSLPRLVPHPRGSKKQFKGKIISLHPTSNGYLSAALYVDGTTRRNMNVQRMVAEAFIPNPDNLPEVEHKDKNRANNRVDNLKWITRLGNVCRGEEHPMHKLTAEQVRYIRTQLAAGAYVSDLAGLFDVSRTAVYAIKNNKKWRAA